MRNMKHIERLRLTFYFSGRPWYCKDGRVVVSPSGVPHHVEDWRKLSAGFAAAFAAIGATLEGYSRKDSRPSAWSMKRCQTCKKQFEAKRSTARFCKTCRIKRTTHAEKKKNPEYVEENRRRAKKGMKDLRKRVGDRPSPRLVSERRKARIMKTMDKWF